MTNCKCSRKVSFHCDVSQLLTQIQDLQKEVNSLTDARDFYDPETASSSRASHVPSEPLNIPNPRGMLCRDSGSLLDTRNSMSTSRNVFESLPAREGPSSALFENSRNLASPSCELTSGNIMEHGRGVRRFYQGLGTLNPLYHTGGTYSQNGVMDYPRYPISELHPRKIPRLIGISKLESQLQDCSRCKISRGRRDFPDEETVGAKIACALKKIPTSVQFRRRVSVEEQRAQTYDRFLRGRQITYMINEHFRAIGAYEAE